MRSDSPRPRLMLPGALARTLAGPEATPPVTLCQPATAEAAICPNCGTELHLWASFHRCRNCGFKESCCF
ncbi:MAG: hypothetical protein RMK84_19685 [Oscillochloridaceae bacterium]|nr:hypothetical protein [Chloroflexaceae bacterium]MDW8392345.1 hypothetical protein [Oscillochloridaceae bacterium]